MKYIDLNTNTVGTLVKEQINESTGVKTIEIRTESGIVISTSNYKQFLLS